MKRLSFATYINMAVTIGGVIVTILWFSFGTASNGIQNTKDIVETKQTMAAMQQSISSLQNTVAVSQANTIQISRQLTDLHDDIKGIYKLILENKTAYNGNVKYTEASY